MPVCKTKIEISADLRQEMFDRATNNEYVRLNGKGVAKYDVSVTEEETAAYLLLGDFDKRWFPKELDEYVLYIKILKLNAGDVIAKHADATRQCSLFYGISDDFVPLKYDTAEVPGDGSVYLINHQEMHWVERTKKDRYNIQATFNKTFDEMKEILDDLGLI